MIEALESAQGFLATAVHALEDKKHRFLEHVNLDLETPEVGAGVVDRLNAEIRMYNQASNEFEAPVVEARKRLATDMIAANLEEFVRHRDASDRAKANVQEKTQEVLCLDG